MCGILQFAISSSERTAVNYDTSGTLAVSHLATVRQWKVVLCAWLVCVSCKEWMAIPPKIAPTAGFVLQ